LGSLIKTPFFSSTIATFARQRKEEFLASSSVALVQRKRDLPVKNSFFV